MRTIVTKVTTRNATRRIPAQTMEAVLQPDARGVSIWDGAIGVAA
jgi:hypothetical protein